MQIAISFSWLQFENCQVPHLFNSMAHTQKTKIPIPTRECVVTLWAQGDRFTSIASKRGISNRAASNIINNMAEREHLLALKPGGKETQIATPNVIEYIEYQKISKPSTSAIELQAALVRNRVCRHEKFPSKSTISDILCKDLQYTYKKLHAVS